MLLSTLTHEQIASHQLINQDSGNVEYYTDPKIIEAARDVMGSIDLDPASSYVANQTIRARWYFTKEIDGLSRRWDDGSRTPSNVWMNHPFSRGEKACSKDRSRCKKKACRDRGFHIDEDTPSNADWIDKLVEEYQAGRVAQACAITFAATSESWFSSLYQGVMCFLSPRTNYYLPDGTKKRGVTKGSVVTYFGANVERFVEVFDAFGYFPNRERVS